jgi:hypothetical protein
MRRAAYRYPRRAAQVREVRGQEVVCVAQNDALLGGLLTVIHSELDERGMSSIQARPRDPQSP